jgi:hypothetical protein
MTARSRRRPCVFDWCGKPAKVLEHNLAHATEEPYFCSYKHAAWWALAHIDEGEAGEAWCEKGQHYVSADGGCMEHREEP